MRQSLSPWLQYLWVGEELSGDGFQLSQNEAKLIDCRFQNYLFGVNLCSLFGVKLGHAGAGGVVGRDSGYWAKPNTDVVSRKVADEGLGSRGEDVGAEAKKTPRECGF
jgi:hypothetical protein